MRRCILAMLVSLVVALCTTSENRGRDLSDHNVPRLRHSRHLAPSKKTEKPTKKLKISTNGSNSTHRLKGPNRKQGKSPKKGRPLTITKIPIQGTKSTQPIQERNRKQGKSPKKSIVNMNSSLPKLADNHKPIFTDCSKYRPSIKEQQPPGTYIFTVKADDPDPPERGGTVTYQFVNTPGEKDRFTVEETTGRIKSNDEFDHDEPSREKELYITVRASDNGNPQLDAACTIRILIEDINDNPPVFDKVSYSESVPQDLPSGREVMRISATDIDDGNNSIVHYSLDSRSPDIEYFRIDPDNGVIYLNKTIDKSPGYKFILNAFATDMGKESLQSFIKLDIQVIDSNKKSPSFVEYPDGPILLKENYSDFNKPLATLKAVSNIPGELKLQFELVQGQTEQTNKWHTFVLEPDGNIANIKLGNHMDYERITDYTLTVRITNNYRLAAETAVEIHVLDVNDNIPIFSEIRTGSVLENEPPGTFVMQVRAFDYDGTSANNQVTYELADPSDPFMIDPITGNITTMKKFDREEQAFYNIKIIATDNSESALIPHRHNTGQQVFIIEIADKNDNAPHFTQDTYVAESIAENANINELVTQVTAVDSDAAAVITYNIVSGNINGAFVIKNVTGEIRVANALDYETISTYSLDVRAWDGVYEDYCKVIINIENLNDNPPVFLDNYSMVLQEEKIVNGCSNTVNNSTEVALYNPNVQSKCQCLLVIAAYDPDIKDRDAPQMITYSLVKSEQREFLTIDDEGCLQLIKPLDRDPPNGFDRWQVLIVAADHGGKPGSDSLRATTEVILILTDINDNAPFLTNTQPVIWDENQLPGDVVVLTAKDYDSPENGPPFTFTIDVSASDEVFSKFSIRGNVLQSLVTLDREEKKKYMIPIAITDSGTPRQTGVSWLTLVVGDRNDNPMASGHSKVFVYNYKGDTPDTEIGRVYVKDPDDWDSNNKTFNWLPSFESRNQHFDIHYKTGMITMRQGTPPGEYNLKFNVTEENLPMIPMHSVEATVDVTVKNIPEEAVDRSGSFRFINCTAEQFILPESDATSKKDKLQRRLAGLFNTSISNVDIFTVFENVTNGITYLDTRYSAHGSPYYKPEKMDTQAALIVKEIENLLKLDIYMVPIDECLSEVGACNGSCYNVLMKNNAPLAVYTNKTSFIGVTAIVKPVCVCKADAPETFGVCHNGGTFFDGRCECPNGLFGPRCELTSIGFAGDGFAVYPNVPVCEHIKLALTVTAHCNTCLIFYVGPVNLNEHLGISDFMSLEVRDGYPLLLTNYGSGIIRNNHSVIPIGDGKPHLIEIIMMKTSIEMFVDSCKTSHCMSLAAPVGSSQFLNSPGPLQIGGTVHDMDALADEFKWTVRPTSKKLVGCVSNFTISQEMVNLGAPSFSQNADPSCQRSTYTAVMFGIDANFLIVILVCLTLLVILLLAVVVHRKRNDTWAEKEMDDIRENIIAYEDEGGGEGDAGYNLHVLRQMYDGPPPDGDAFMPHAGVAHPPPISGFLDDKKSVADRDPEVNPSDDVRHYAYEGDGNTTGSLSSLASSATADGDLEFSYLENFGPRFRKLADMYGDNDNDRARHEESWC